MERRLAAILVADVVGYTRLMGRDESGTLARMQVLRRDLIDPLLARHRGRIFKLTGDGLLVEFASARDAVHCAIAWQKEIPMAESERDPETRFQFRIGLNLGDVLLEKDDIHGDGVNVAARLEALAQPNGICLSEALYRQVRGKLDAEFEDLGEQLLKNVAEPVRVYRIAGDAGASPGASPAATTNPRNSAFPDKPSIAVLPFANMSDDPDQEYFSDGISEDIITELSRFSSLFVIARNSSFAYKGQSLDVRKIAEDLKVRYLLEGSVRRAGQRIRITAQLIDSTIGNHVWAERYDRVIEDIFDLQEKITANVVTSIAPQIEIAELGRAHGSDDASFTAYDLGLKAKAVLFDGIKSCDPATLELAVAAADEVLKIDPRNIQALWTQGFAYHILYSLGAGGESDQVLARASEVTGRLSEIDSANPYCCMILGAVAWDRGEHEEALGHLRRGYALNPNFAWNLFSLSWCEALAGLTEEARAHAELGLRLSPRDMDFWLGVAKLTLALAHFADGNYEEAKYFGKQALEYQPKAPIRRTVVIASCSRLGQTEEAAQRLRSFKSFAPDFVARLLAGGHNLYSDPAMNDFLRDAVRQAALDA